MHSIKDRNGMDLTEAEDIKKRWPEYTEELYKKFLLWKLDFINVTVLLGLSLVISVLLERQPFPVYVLGTGLTTFVTEQVLLPSPIPSPPFYHHWAEARQQPGSI